MCKSSLLCFFLALSLVGTAAAVQPKSSVFDRELQKVRYNYAYESYRNEMLAEAGESAFSEPIEFDDAAENASELGYKSPGKAFVYSLVVPGLGQWYYGSRVKPFLFFGAEVAAWVLHFKWHSDAERMEDDFEAFNRAHWSRDAYEQQYLLWAYGETDDDLINEQEISHHLPDTRTQQYYEMTGKYNQFAWGWDDAVLGGNVLGDYGPGNPPPQIESEATTPASARREAYEYMRDDANNKFDDATKMIFVSMLNRLASAFEALIFTKKHNNAVRGNHQARDLTSWKFSPSLKSIHSTRDTPYIKVTYRF
jgi:hypothetical protein